MSSGVENLPGHGSMHQVDGEAVPGLRDNTDAVAVADADVEARLDLTAKQCRGKVDVVMRAEVDSRYGLIHHV